MIQELKKRGYYIKEYTFKTIKNNKIVYKNNVEIDEDIYVICGLVCGNILLDNLKVQFTSNFESQITTKYEYTFIKETNQKDVLIIERYLKTLNDIIATYIKNLDAGYLNTFIQNNNSYVLQNYVLNDYVFP